MLQFQPLGFGQRVIKTSLGVMVYYTPVGFPWQEAEAQIDRPILLFLHSLGGGSSAYEWSKVYPAFAPSYRVIAPDLIGWGQSTHPERDYRVEDYFAVITELIEQLGAPVRVAAASLTGGIVARLAIDRPDLFHSLFLVSPAGYGESGAEYGRGIAAQVAGIPGVDRLLYSLGAANELAVRNFLQTFLFVQSGRITDEMVAAYVASAQQRNAEYAALASLRGDLCFDLTLYLDRLQIPTALIWGEGSRFGSLDLARRLASLNPTMIQPVQTIPQAGVLPHLEVPEVVIGLLQKFLSASKQR